MGKALDGVVSDLIELGMSERKIVNMLKRLKEDMIPTKKEIVTEKSKEFNKLINDMLFSYGAFQIDVPSKPLLGLRRVLTDKYGSEYIYFMLTRILADKFFYKDYYEKSDEEKSNILMYRIRENNIKLRDEFLMINSVSVKEPNIDISYLDIDDEEELGEIDKDSTPTYYVKEGEAEWI